MLRLYLYRYNSYYCEILPTESSKNLISENTGHAKSESTQRITSSVLNPNFRL